MKKNFLLKNVNMVTGKEKIFIDFEKGKVREGKEKIYFTNPPIKTTRNMRDESSISPIKYQFDVKDDYNERNILNRIGTTITNLLNKSNNLLLILNNSLRELKNLDIEDIKRINEKVLNTIDKYNLKTYKSNEIIRTIYEINNIIEDYGMQKQLYYDQIEDYEEPELCYKFLEEIYLLKRKYISELDLVILIDSILQNEADIENKCFYQIILSIVKEMQEQLEKQLNKPLTYLLKIIFQQFYSDFRVENSEYALMKFLKYNEERQEKHPYNNYYKKLDVYMSGLYKCSIEEIKKIKSLPIRKEKEFPKKFEKFTYKDIAIVFIKSLIYDINFMQKKYRENMKFTYNNVIKKEKNVYEYEISSLGELFYISKHYILENRTCLKRCKTCDKFFIAEKPERDINCQRIYKKKYTCREYASRYFRYGDKRNNIISKNDNRIKTYIRKLKNEKKITEESAEKMKSQCDEIKNSNELTEEEKINQLQKLHQDIKDNIKNQANNISSKTKQLKLL